MTTPTPSFDNQAEDFDRRAGIPIEAAARVAEALIELAGLGGGGRLLEIGAGTGEIGAHLITQGVELSYVALDRSPGMLERFAERLPPTHGGQLVVGDADARWPIEDGGLEAVFLSRVAHLLDPLHLWSEARRTAAAGGSWMIIGRRERERDSVRASLRRQMRGLLADEGVEARGGGGGTRRMLEDMQARGGDSPVRRTVARWDVVHRPIEALDAWRSKSGLAGVELDPGLKARVLDRLEGMARERYGDLEAAHPSEERYDLYGIRVPEAARDH